MATGNNITFTKIPDCFGITIVKGDGVFHNFTEHFHRSYNIGVIRSGEALMKIGSIEKMIGKDFMYFINPLTIHSMGNFGDNPISYSVISIEDKTFNNILHGENLLFKNEIDRSPVKANVITKCINIIMDKMVFAIEKEESFFRILSGLQLENKSDIQIKKENIDNAIAYINNNFKEPIHIKEISAVSYMSSFHFIREFKKYVGLSPAELIIQLRIKEAQNMLIDQNSIADTAIAAGFYDQSHFTKYFKKYVGVSPKKYISNYNVSK